MKKNKQWFRCIVLANGSEVLVIKELSEDEPEAPYKVSVTCDFDGVRGSVDLCFKTQKAQHDCFTAYPLAQAEAVYSNLSQFY